MGDDKPFHNPFGALAGMRGVPAPQPEARPVSEPKPAVEPGQPRVARAVVRVERTGRGGKEVTRIEHLNLPPIELERWLKSLKSSLGCGGSIEDQSILLQGDQRDRLVKVLSAKGVRKITT
jgi:translation initiation factor 1